MKYIKKSWIIMLSIPLAIWGFIASQENDHSVLSDLEINGFFTEQAHAAHWNNRPQARAVTRARATNSTFRSDDDGGDGE